MNSSCTHTHTHTQQWNDELVNVAQTYAEGCEFEHNPNRVAQQGTFASVGENLGTRSSLTAIANADLQQLMTAWDNEKSDYNFQTNSCTAVCGHYTQVCCGRRFGMFKS